MRLCPDARRFLLAILVQVNVYAVIDLATAYAQTEENASRVTLRIPALTGVHFIGGEVRLSPSSVPKQALSSIGTASLGRGAVPRAPH
jgi:hypothetical protein